MGFAFVGKFRGDGQWPDPPEGDPDGPINNNGTVTITLGPVIHHYRWRIEAPSLIWPDSAFTLTVIREIRLYDEEWGNDAWVPDADFNGYNTAFHGLWIGPAKSEILTSSSLRYHPGGEPLIIDPQYGPDHWNNGTWQAQVTAPKQQTFGQLQIDYDTLRLVLHYQSTPRVTAVIPVGIWRYDRCAYLRTYTAWNYEKCSYTRSI